MYLFIFIIIIIIIIFFFNCLGGFHGILFNSACAVCVYILSVNRPTDISATRAHLLDNLLFFFFFFIMGLFCS